MNWILIYTALAVCNTHITEYATPRSPIAWDPGFQQCEKIQALVRSHEHDVRAKQLIEHPDDDAKIVAAAAKELGIGAATVSGPK
jgi:hypothetical protein